MKRALPVLLFTIASSAFAGLTYKTQSTTTGFQNISISGTVTVDGSRMRMDVDKGDNMLFKDKSFVLSTDGGKTMSVFDPATKNYYEVQLDQLLGNATAMFKGLGDMVKVSFDNPQVSVNDAGDGGTIEGFPTRKYVLNASYDMNIDAMGQKMTSHLSMKTESWTTDQLTSEMTNFLQMRGMRTGVDSLDKLIEAQGNGMKGFPLKQVSAVHVTQGMNDMLMTTTATVTNVEKKNIDAAVFTVPTGYAKVDDPVTKMLKALKQ